MNFDRFNANEDLADLNREAKQEAEIERILALRDKALRFNVGGQVMQAEAILDKLCPTWREAYQ
jgi:hypothetical protein